MDFPLGYIHQISYFNPIKPQIMQKLILLFALVVCSFTMGQSQSIRYDHTIPILTDVVPTEEHKAKDVFVSRTDGKYAIEFYIQHSGKLNKHKAYVV